LRLRQAAENQRRRQSQANSVAESAIHLLNGKYYHTSQKIKNAFRSAGIIRQKYLATEKWELKWVSPGRPGHFLRTGWILADNPHPPFGHLLPLPRAMDKKSCLIRAVRAKFKAMSDTLVVNEIYLSLQGESTFAGLPCIFIRLTACDLRCSYCDTAYAFTEGKKMPLEKVLEKVSELARPFANARSSTLNLQPSTFNSQLPLVELTGGEPLLQKRSLPLMQSLCDDGYTVLIETSGAHDISRVDPRVRRIMDLKCPSSGEVERNLFANIPHLKAADEVKFVIGTVEDYEWAKAQVARYALASVCPVLFSWVHPLAPEQQSPALKNVPAGQTPITRRALAENIIADALPVRFQIQQHKIIWPAEQRGV
jgi:7-carboxy-7-deazaguanine synthase